jgi:hypothetical protein
MTTHPARLQAFAMDKGVDRKRYEIVVRGRLSERYGAAFEGMTLHSHEGKTTLSGAFLDQSHLYGVINGLRDLGIELISVTADAGERCELPRERNAR